VIVQVNAQVMMRHDVTLAAYAATLARPRQRRTPCT
jgi:hypothetical protein